MKTWPALEEQKADLVGGYEPGELPQLLLDLRRWNGLLVLDHPGGRTAFPLRGGRILGAKSPFLPPWRISQAWRKGQDLKGLLAERLVLALMPLWRGPGRFAFYRAQVQGGVAEGVGLEGLVLEVQRQQDELSTPLDPFYKGFAYRVPPLEPQAEAFLGLMNRGFPLAQAAAWAHLSWDWAQALLPLLRPFRPLGRLAPGDRAPVFALEALQGGLVTLGQYRKGRLLLAFYRQGGCALCNPRTRDLIRLYPRLQALGVGVLLVWASPLGSLARRVGRLSPPFPLLSDPDGRVYRLYGVGYSLPGILHPRNLPVALEGVRMPTFGPELEGQLLRMPAEFLLGPDLRVEVAHYARFAADFLPPKAILAWAEGGQKGQAFTGPEPFPREG